MKISIAGKDRTEELGQQVAAEAARLKVSGSIGSLTPEHSALSLRKSANRDDYAGRFIDLLRLRHGVRTTDYYIPRGPGLRGAVALGLKTILWKLLRYQHDRITFQQNLVNELAVDALEFQRDQRDRDLADIRRRLDRFEAERREGAPP